MSAATSAATGGRAASVAELRSLLRAETVGGLLRHILEATGQSAVSLREHDVELSRSDFCDAMASRLRGGSGSSSAVARDALLSATFTAFDWDGSERISLSLVVVGLRAVCVSEAGAAAYTAAVFNLFANNVDFGINRPDFLHIVRRASACRCAVPSAPAPLPSPSCLTPASAFARLCRTPLLFAPPARPHQVTGVLCAEHALAETAAAAPFPRDVEGAAERAAGASSPGPRSMSVTRFSRWVKQRRGFGGGGSATGSGSAAAGAGYGAYRPPASAEGPVPTSQTSAAVPSDTSVSADIDLRHSLAILPAEVPLLLRAMSATSQYERFAHREFVDLFTTWLNQARSSTSASAHKTKAVSPRDVAALFETFDTFDTTSPRTVGLGDVAGGLCSLALHNAELVATWSVRESAQANKLLCDAVVDAHDRDFIGVISTHQFANFVKSILCFACVFDAQAAEEMASTTPEHVAQAMSEAYFQRAGIAEGDGVTRDQLLEWFASARGG